MLLKINKTRIKNQFEIKNLFVDDDLTRVFVFFFLSLVNFLSNEINCYLLSPNEITNLKSIIVFSKRLGKWKTKIRFNFWMYQDNIDISNRLIFLNFSITWLLLNPIVYSFIFINNTKSMVLFFHLFRVIFFWQLFT